MALVDDIVTPGDIVPPSALPPAKKGVLILGPGLRHTPPSDIVSTTVGVVSTDPRKGALWLEHDSGRYIPTVGDLVIAQVHHSATEQFYCIIAPYSSNAILGHLSFEGASRKTRPQLKTGDLVYARVSRATKGEDVEIECFNAATGKADGLGQLKGGMTWKVSISFARRLMMPSGSGNIFVLEALGEKLNFEVAVGRNGIVWIQTTSPASTLVVGNLLVQCETEKWTTSEQTAAVKKALKSLGLAG